MSLRGAAGDSEVIGSKFERYGSVIGLGEPMQNVTVILDTGSVLLAVLNAGPPLSQLAGADAKQEDASTKDRPVLFPRKRGVIVVNGATATSHFTVADFGGDDGVQQGPAAAIGASLALTVLPHGPRSSALVPLACPCLSACCSCSHCHSHCCFLGAYIVLVSADICHHKDHKGCDSDHPFGVCHLTPWHGLTVWLAAGFHRMLGAPVEKEESKVEQGIHRGACKWSFCRLL